MAGRVVLVHGWSATSASFAALRTFLDHHNFKVTDIWLADYISLDDDVTVGDVVKRMQRVFQADADKLQAPFDMIVHSTGGLVVREWIASLFEAGKVIPVQRLLMLAPANSGSALASKGKSLIGRALVGFDNWLQVGQQMLDELELASTYQWELAQRDLISSTGETKGPFGPGRTLPFVIVGTRGYDSGFKQFVNEAGSDGTVRPCSANMNLRGFTINFADNQGDPKVTAWSSRLPTLVPLAVLPDRDHGTILDPLHDTGATTSPLLGELIMVALDAKADGSDYADIAAKWQAVSDGTAATATNSGLLSTTFRGKPPNAQQLHQFMQIVVHVRDDQGHDVKDYFLEFYCPDVAGEDDAAFFHASIIDDVHTFAGNASRRCLFIDRTDLVFQFYDGVRSKVGMSISAAAPGNDVAYFNSTKVGARGEVIVHQATPNPLEDAPDGLQRNCTHLVEIIIPRQPTDKVFTLST